MIKFSTLLFVLSAISFSSSAIEGVKPNIPQLPSTPVGQLPIGQLPGVPATPDIGAAIGALGNPLGH